MIDGFIVVITLLLNIRIKPHTNILHVSRYNQEGNNIIKSNIIQIIILLRDSSLVQKIILIYTK